MPSYVTATVTEVLEQRRGLQRVETTAGRSYVLTQLIGEVAIGDDVIVNTTAVELKLGTGGWHVVHWNLSRSEWNQAGPGHIMKMRYGTTQIDAGAAEEAGERPHVAPARRPVVVCQLHSQAALVATVIRHRLPDARIAYVMTDQAALPLAISDVMHSLSDKGIVDQTITAGQAFGGDLEAVNVASGMELAFDHGADVVIVSQGPGVVGTNTKLGFSGLEAVHHLRDAELAGATPVFCLRWSDADERPRHKGLSHHSATVLDRSSDDLIYGMPRTRGDVAIFAGDARVVDVPNIDEVLAAMDVRITTMGRGPADDPGFFAFTSAAAVVAAEILAARAQ